MPSGASAWPTVPERGWRARLCAAFAAYAAEVVEEPEAARLVLIEALGAGPAAAARMQRTRLTFEEMLAASFAEAPDGVELSPLIVKGIVCGVERITRQRLLAGEVAEIPALADELLAWALAYRTPAAARLSAPSSMTSPYSDRPARPRSAARLENDWARVLRCTAEIAAANGYAQLTPRRIAQQADVTEARFDELFESTEQCFLDALDRLGLEVLVCAARAFQDGEQGLAAIHRAITALMWHIATNPVVARVAFVEIFALGPAGFQRRERLLGQFTDEFVRVLPKSPAVSRVATDASVGAVWGIIHHHVARGAARVLPELAGHVTYIALAPVVGGRGRRPGGARGRRRALSVGAREWGGSRPESSEMTSSVSLHGRTRLVDRALSDPDVPLFVIDLASVETYLLVRRLSYLASERDGAIWCPLLSRPAALDLDIDAARSHAHAPGASVRGARAPSGAGAEGDAASRRSPPHGPVPPSSPSGRRAWPGRAARISIVSNKARAWGSRTRTMTRRNICA